MQGAYYVQPYTAVRVYLERAQKEVRSLSLYLSIVRAVDLLCNSWGVSQRRRRREHLLRNFPN